MVRTYHLSINDLSLLGVQYQPDWVTSTGSYDEILGKALWQELGKGFGGWKYDKDKEYLWRHFDPPLRLLAMRELDWTSLVNSIEAVQGYITQMLDKAKEIQDTARILRGLGRI